MSSTEAQPILKFDNILVSPRGISEVHASQVVIFVPTEEIDRVTLKFGRSEHRPLLTMSIGLSLMLVGFFGLYGIAVAPGGFRYELGMVVLGAIGGLLIFDTLKQRYFFEVHKRQGVCRLVFSKHAQKEAIQDFCAQVRAEYEYEISDDASYPLRFER